MNECYCYYLGVDYTILVIYSAKEMKVPQSVYVMISMVLVGIDSGSIASKARVLTSTPQ